MRNLFLVITISIFLAACQKTEKPTAPAETKRYDLKGKVISVDRANKKAKIEHENIPGFMEAMTMDFPIREDWIWDDLLPGSEIRAELVVDNAAKDPYYLEKIGIVAAPNSNQPAVPINEKFAQIGREVPDFSLTNQDGKRFSVKDYRGKALAITFIYRECPLPEYCIKMSANFSDLASDIAVNEEFQDKMRLLSISFDPARDTPEKLKQYGLGYIGNDGKADFTVWQLAVGTDKEVRSVADFFGLQYSVDPNDKTQINHSLITAVIAPDGKVTKIFKGNEWSPDDLLRELKAALNQ
ncbi:MAG: SCO family protein [Pyrinomonadaceae bacterium]